MKDYLLFTGICFFLVSCGNNKAEQTGAEEFDLPEKPVKTVWEATLNDSTGALEMKRVETSKIDSLSVESVINFISTSEIKPEFLKNSNDTVFIKIPDAEFLTQRMGTTGASLYLASAIYNLTEIPGIHFVNLDFEEGDHAGPGTYSRDSFKNQ
jgi:hypothetical protein